MTEDSIRVSPGRPTTTGGETRGTGTGSRRPARAHVQLPVPSELLVLVAAVVAVLVAAAVAENFTAPSAWTLVTVLAAAFILTRGLVKRGHGDDGL